MSRSITRRAFVALALIGIAACARKPGAGEDLYPVAEPIPLHVKNENFLDMNIYVVVNSLSRRLGTVTGNGQADFMIEWNMVGGQAFAITGVPIGGRGSATTGPLNIGPDQMIEFRIASSLRQSAVSVHERP